MAASAESKNYVQKMFIAFLGRAAAPDGLEYYGALIDADEDNGKAILFDDLYYSDQGQSLYAGLETYEVVTIIFNNIMGRDPATPGLLYWTNAIDDGVFNVSEAAAIIADSAANDADDLAALNAKTTAADAVTAELEANPDLVAGFQSNFSLSRDQLADVTAANVGTFDAAASTSAVAAGYASNSTLTTGNDTVAGTADFVDVVTGTVGTGATLTAGDSISDPDSGDGDIVNLSGDDDVDLSAPATGITGFETVNLDLEKQEDGNAFAITNVGNDVETMTLTVAETTEVVEIEVNGQTTATIAGDLAADITTTNVTSLTATTTGTGSYSITGDADLATVTTVDSNDAGVSITLSAASSTVSIDGADGANDAATISAVGAVALDVNGAGGQNVDDLTLSGNGAAVTYTLSGADSGTEYTIAGDQDVTLSGDNDAFNGNAFTDSSTGGVTTIELTGATSGTTNLEAMGVLSGGVDVAAAVVAQTMTIASGNTVTLSADQANDITFDGNDTAAGGTFTLNMDNDAADLTFADYETVSINTGSNAASATDIATGANDTLNLAGTSSFTVNDIDAGTMDIDVSGAVVANDLTGTGASDSSISVEGDDITVNALDSSNSNDAITLTSTANDIAIASTTDAGTGAVTITSAGDLTATTVDGGAVSIEGADVTVTAITGSSVSLTSTNDSAASELTGIDSTGDITITGGTWTQSAADNINANDGTLTLAGADVTITGTNDVWAGSIVITGAADADLGDQVNTSVVNANAATGDLTMTIDANDGAAGVTVQTGAGNDNIEVDQLNTIFNLTTGGADDTVTITNSDKVTLNTGTGDDTVNIDNANDTLTINTSDGNDTVEINNGGIDAAATINTGIGADEVNIDAGSVGAALTVNTEAGADTVQIDDTGNDVTVNTGAGDDSVSIAASTASNVNTGDDDDTITLAGDSDAVIDAGDGTDSLVLASTDYSGSDLSFSNIESVDITAGNDAVLSAAQFADDNTFDLVGTGNAATSFITIQATTANDTTIDASGVTTSVVDTGTVNINGNDGNDTLTHNAYSGTIQGNDGDDTIDGKAGQDTIVGGAGADNMTGGADADTFVFADGDNDVGIDVANDTMDTITDFVTGTDRIDVSGFAQIVGNDSNDVVGTTANDVSEVLDLANDKLNAAGVTEDIIVVTNAMGSGDSYVYINVDNDNKLDDNDILIIIEDATPATGDFI